jgi:hypothetical protein
MAELPDFAMNLARSARETQDLTPGTPRKNKELL